MKKDIDYKAPNGKLIRLEVDLDKDVIKFIKISGDFFVYPETAITEIENKLSGKKILEVNQVVNEFIKKKDIKIIGFNSLDLTEALMKSEKI